MTSLVLRDGLLQVTVIFDDKNMTPWQRVYVPAAIGISATLGHLVYDYQRRNADVNVNVFS